MRTYSAEPPRRCAAPSSERVRRAAPADGLASGAGPPGGPPLRTGLVATGGRAAGAAGGAASGSFTIGPASGGGLDDVEAAQVGAQARKAQVFHVNTDLMSTAGKQAATDYSKPPVALQDFVFGDGFPYSFLSSSPLRNYANTKF